MDEANGLIHLRPREGTYSAQEYNAAQSIGMNCALLSIKVRIGRKSGGEAGKAHTNGHAIPCSRGVVGVRESARMGCCERRGPPLVF